jgi:hypothetical protein
MTQAQMGRLPKIMFENRSLEYQTGSDRSGYDQIAVSVIGEINVKASQIEGIPYSANCPIF